MINIWGFIIQTTEVSLMAIILLGLKRLFKDKLSPRWQYSVWFILVISIIVPTGIWGTYIFPYLDIFIKAIKTIIERGLHSNFTNANLPINNLLSIPLITSIPSSITDLIFCIYVIGIIVYLCCYFFQYQQIKRILLSSKNITQELKYQIENVSQTYHLKSCKAVMIPNLPSPFIFGIIKPILVIPENSQIDDKIILHELLHLKYKDSLQCVFWSFLKTLHWCNPFLQYVFNQIYNDLESLCDQRVLELIIGKQRRDYGKILLAMTNDKYTHAFATTSISNGGSNIKKRIEAIVQFKQYPQGMKVVSICIAVLLLPLALTGMSPVPLLPLNNKNISSLSYQLSMASARIQECTLAGAIDTYAKGILKNDDLYLTAVMPFSQLKNHQKVLKNKPQKITSNPSAFDQFTGIGLYNIINLKQLNQNEYQAELFFLDASNPYRDTENNIYGKYSVIPIKIIKEKGWKVAQRGETITQLFTNENYQYLKLPDDITITEDCLSGKIDFNLQTKHYLDMDEPSYSLETNLDAKIQRVLQNIQVTYTCTKPKNDMNSICLSVEELKNIHDKPKFDLPPSLPSNSAGSTSDGSFYECKLIDNNWNSTITTSQNFDLKTDNSNYPEAFAIRIYINNEIVDEMKISLKDVNNYE